MLIFIDIETSKENRILDIGCVSEFGDKIRDTDQNNLEKFIKKGKFFAGHNFVTHDLKYLRRLGIGSYLKDNMIIDTLYLSALLSPTEAKHAIEKDYKSVIDYKSDPLIDSLKTKELFYELEKEFNSLDNDMKEIFYNLLKDELGYTGFFKYIKYSKRNRNLEQLIKNKFNDLLCENANLKKYIKHHNISLAFVLSFININKEDSLFSPWIRVNYPIVEQIIKELRNTPCITGCIYCSDKMDSKKALKRYFDYDSFRNFNGVPLQEEATNSALKGNSLLAIFPTGGGKSLAFQLPALINKETTNALTVVISPLQSLMKDQVDNLEAKNITSAVTINGLLDPIQRADAIKRVIDGSAGILYISPEFLRSKTLERILNERQIARFVIDEAHCFSTWGQDFRVDYLYIAEFIKKIEKNNKNKQIPISCFTATAKKDVIEDITDYFKERLNLDLVIFQAKGRRENLEYQVHLTEESDDKYRRLRDIILQENCPTIIYSSRTKTVDDVYQRLYLDKFSVAKFHGKMETEHKIEEQNKFKNGEAMIMVATSAFGMGVDKDDVGCVIHYDISDSLENYVQESGRAGRSDKIEAKCYILFNENDLNKHFELLNSSKLNIDEIKSVWRAIKNLTKLRNSVSLSALEIAKAAGWNEEVYGLETKIMTAVSTLEEAGYLKRGQNSPRVFANSILSKTLIDAKKIMEDSKLFNKEDFDSATRILSLLISSKRRSMAGNELAESRVDYIASILGLTRTTTIRIINLLRECKVLADDQDLNAVIKANSKPGMPLRILNTQTNLLNILIEKLSEETKTLNLKQLNEEAISSNISNNINDLIIALNYLNISKLTKSTKIGRDNLKIKLEKPKEKIIDDLKLTSLLADVIIRYLYEKSSFKKENENLVSFSILELKKHYDKTKGMLDPNIKLSDIEAAILFLQRIKALHIEGGFLVLYSPINIERIVKDNYRSYTKADYQSLNQYYNTKREQIHIVGEYAKKIINNYQEALIFVDDYFTMDYNLFLQKYFAGIRKEEIKENMTPNMFNQLFGALSIHQLNIVKDKTNSPIAVIAGPGSGKTRLLIHKLASILSTEDIKANQLLMLTLSRVAVTEFKTRLIDLIGALAYSVDIMTFHSFAFDILGKYGSLENSSTVIMDATELIKNEQADNFKITRSVLVIDEAQDMSKEEFEMIETLIKYNEGIRVIAVGDDDQNIFEFRGSSSEYFKNLAKDKKAIYELPVNYRSKNNLVEFTNQFAEKIRSRLKTAKIIAHNKNNGKVVVNKQTNGNLIIPLVKEVIADNLDGKTCIITKTNDDAVVITGLLNHENVGAKLIQSNDNFRLLHLQELNYFYRLLHNEQTALINEDQWSLALKNFNDTFSQSDNYELAIKVLETFKTTVGEKVYLSDLNQYLFESNMSDFELDAKIVVSTFHKAKGKEFDNVYIHYDSEYNNLPDRELRALYVGLTRAKTNLTIYTNSNIFDDIKINSLIKNSDDSIKEIPKTIIFELGHSEVNLGYFSILQNNMENLLSGCKLVRNGKYLTYNNRRVVLFSNAAQAKIEEMESKGYELSEAVAKNLVYWYNREKEQTYLIVLPQLTFERCD